MVVGNVMTTNPDGDIVPVYGLNVTALDVSYPQTGTADYIYLGETADGRVSSLVSDITDKNGNFKLIVPLIDLQGDSTTPDLLLRAIFDSDDFLILKHGVGNFGINRSVLSTHSDTDVRARPNISGPFFDYGTFELPRHSIASRASYILNSLQPVHDWYASDVGYAPDRSVINWTPDVCVPFGVDPTSNVLDLHEVTGHGGRLCPDTLSSSLENPQTLRHEYAHQVQNQIYLDRNTSISAEDCSTNSDEIHSPVHASGPKCAWTEGWAFFMATAYDQNPIYQPNYMIGQWNFETRTNTETVDSRFANKDFVTGNQEGNVASMLYDIIDDTNENQDDLRRDISNIWDAMDIKKRPPIRTVYDFKSNWDSTRFPSLDNVFALNTLSLTDPSILSPILSEISDVTLLYFQIRNIMVSATISNNSPITLDLIEDAGFATIQDNGDGTGIITLEPRFVDIGTNTITVQASANGNTHNESFDVRVSRNSGGGGGGTNPPPAPPPVGVPDAIDNLSFSYNDNYSQVTLSWSPPNDNGSPITAWRVESFGSGLIWRLSDVLHDETVTTWTANVAQGYTYQYRVSAYNEDGLGPASNIAIVAVPDVTAPNIGIRGNSPVEILLGMPYVELGAVAFDNHDGTITDRIVTTGSVDTNTAGTYQIVYSVSDDAANTAQTVRTVTVTAPDDTPPIITAPDDITAEVTCPGTSVNLGQATATDNTDSNPTITSNSTSQFPPGTTIVIWTATDASGNMANATQTVIIRDTINPVLVPIDDLVSESITVNDYANLAPSVTDNSCDIIVPTHDAPESFPVGTTIVTWTATDTAGNSASTTHIVTIQDRAPPVITAPLDVTAEVTCPGTTISLGTAMTSDNHDENPEITHDAPKPFPLGTTTVTWTATDYAGNVATDEQLVTVRDTTPPVIDVLTNPIWVNSMSNFERVSLMPVNVTDNSCNPVSLANDAPELFQQGLTKVTWTAIDSFGNESIATQFVAVAQHRTTDMSPSISVPSDIIVYATDSAGTIVHYDAPTATDYRGSPLDVTCTPDSGIVFPIGNNKVMCSTTDSEGYATMEPIYITVAEYNAGLITESRPGYLIFSGHGTFDGQPTLNEEFSYTINIVNHGSENPNVGRIGELANLIFYHPVSYELISVDNARLDVKRDVTISGQPHRNYLLESNKPLPGQTVSIEFIFVPRTTDDITMRTHMHSITDNGHTTAHTLRDSFSALP